MRTTNKTFAVLLLLTLGMNTALTACSEQTDNPSESTAPESLQTEASEVTRPMHKVPEQNFDGATYHSFALDWQGYPHYFFAEESNGDSMNDAIFERTTRIEEYLNVNMTSTLIRLAVGNEQMDRVKQNFNAGDDAYQEVLLHCIYGVASLSSEGYLYNIDDLPYVDIQSEWWNQKQMDALRLGKNTYFGVSDYMIPSPYTILVNRTIVENRNMEDPYALVLDKKWTIDKCFEMITSGVDDLNGDSRYTQEDLWGISANEVSKYISFVTGAGQFITQKTGDDQIELAMNTEKMVTLVEKFHEVVTANGAVCTNYDSMQMFNNNKLLFYLTSIADVVSFRDYESNLGILPYPMYDEAQEDYISLDWGGLQCIPGTIQNPEMVSAVMELQAYHSADTVIPAYYDVLLDGKIARDVNTIKMLDILFDTIAYEIGGNYFGFSPGFQNLFFTMGYLGVNQKSANFASYYKQNERPAIKTIESFYDDLIEVENQ